MFKKIFLSFLFIMFLSCTPVFSEQASKNVDLKPLKLEHNKNGYGNLEKNLKQQNEIKENFSNVLTNEETRKEPSVFRVLNSLIFVIFLILLTGWVYMKMKKINPEQLLSGKFNKLNENNFKILSSMQLGAGKAIYLIEINNKQLIIGTTANNVNLLAQMDKEESKNEIPNECIEKLFNNNDDNFKKLED